MGVPSPPSIPVSVSDYVKSKDVYIKLYYGTIYFLLDKLTKSLIRNPNKPNNFD
jgi:hypothetical protein